MNLKRLFASAAMLLAAYGGFAENNDPLLQSEYGNHYQKDERAVSYISPVRVMWMSDQSGMSVKNPDVLLQPFSGQVAVSYRQSFVLSTKDSDTASILLDFGKEYHGGIQIAASIREVMAPVNVRVRFGESVTEAMSDTKQDYARDSLLTATNEHAVRDFTLPVPWLGTVEMGESGFRFVRIDLLDKGVELPLAAIRIAFKYRDIPYLGSFHSDNERLNKIWETGAYTVHMNMQNYIWDGIKRDRLVWLGDLHPEVMTVNTVFGYQNVIPKSLDFGREDTPLPNWMNGMLSYSLWWMISHRDWYLYQGNLDYLEQQHTYIKGLIDQLIPMIEPDGRENLQGAGRFLDWPTSEKPDVVHAGLQALALMAFEAGEDIGQWLGDSELAEKCSEVAARMRNYKPDHLNNKQAAGLLSITGLLNPQQASEVLTAGGANGFSTFYGYYMLEALAKSGDYAPAMKIISDYWGAMNDLGATTYWEDLTYSEVANAGRVDEFVPEDKYDIHADGGAYCYVGLRHSLCHGWASGPTSWLSRYVLGVMPAEPGFSKVRIEPHLGDLQWVEGTFPTPHGVIKVRHEKQADGSIKSDIDLPKGVKLVKK